MDGAESATTWTTADLLKLVGRIRRNTPESEKRSSYHVGLLSVNWDKTAFRPYSAKECHDMWQKVMKKTRKLRSLPDLIAEAEEDVSKPLLHRRDEYEKRHVRGCVKPRRKFDNICKDNNLHRTRKSRKAKLSVIDGLPVKPPLDSLSLLIEENAAEKPSLGSGFVSEMRKRWRKLDAAEKHEYYTRCLKRKHEYNAKLKEYLDRFDETEKQRFIKEQDIRFLKVKPLRTSPCEPKMPSQSIFTYLARDKMMSSAKSKKLLHKLPVKEKERYKEQMRSDMERYSENLRKWFKKLTPEEQTKYLIQKPNKLQFLDAKKKQVCDREEINLSQPSDSEDEDIMEISSEDDIWSSYEDESGEDWDMFEMHR